MPEDPITTYVVLLRGVNVGGEHRLSMAAFVELLTALGAQAPRTFIQSGNAVFSGETRADWAPQIQAGLRERCGLDVPAVVLTAAELRDLVDSDPLRAQGLAEEALSIGFLGAAPPDEAVHALDPERSPGDRFAVVGRAVYLFCPRGVARTKLTNAWFDRQLRTVSTFRNLRTVAALVEMAEE